MPNQCSNFDWENCICICENSLSSKLILEYDLEDYSNSCDDEGKCIEINKKIEINKNPEKFFIPLKKLPIKLKLYLKNSKIKITN